MTTTLTRVSDLRPLTESSRSNDADLCFICGVANSDHGGSHRDMTEVFRGVEVGDLITMHDDQWDHTKCFPEAWCRHAPIADITARCELGIALLDRIAPQWWRLVNERRLDMSSACTCVLGQYGHRFLDDPLNEGSVMYGATLKQVVMPHFEQDPDKTDLWNQDVVAIAHGFYTLRDADYPVMDTLWAAAIAEREAADDV